MCSVCRTPYRGGYAAHAAGVTHRRNAARETTRRQGDVIGRDNGTKRARREAAYRVAGRSQAAYEAAHTVDVKQHKRSKPDDGAAKLVKVRKHERGEPGHGHRTRTEHETIGGTRYAVTYSLRTGKAIDLRELKSKPS